jgi:hypothetical protein
MVILSAKNRISRARVFAKDLPWDFGVRSFAITGIGEMELWSLRMTGSRGILGTVTGHFASNRYAGSIICEA